MSENITISKDRFNIVCVAIGILIIAFLVALYKLSQIPSVPKVEVGGGKENGTLIMDGVTAPISQELKNFLSDNEYVSITFLNKLSQVKVVDGDGVDVEPCGRIEGTTVTGNCDLEDVDIENISDIQTFTVATSPGCPTQNIGGILMQLPC